MKIKRQTDSVHTRLLQYDYSSRKAGDRLDKKVERVISLYNRVVDGEVLVKADEAARYGVNERSIQRDINDIRAYFANDPEANRELVYDRTKNQKY